MPNLSKSSRERSTLASWAIAIKCSTAFVDPPSAITIDIAFSKASFVIISLGFKSRLIKLLTAFPASKESNNFVFEVASCAELFGRLIPMASIAEAIVFAVYIPPHEPGPGIALDSISNNSISEICPSECFPTASKTDITSVLPFPGLMLPP